MKTHLLIITLFLFLSCKDNTNKTKTDVAKHEPQTITQSNIGYEIVVPDLQIPWGFTFLPDQSILITEKSGQLLHFKNGKTTQIKGIPKVEAYGQGGLMDIILHPNYDKNGWIYLSYISKNGNDAGFNTSILRGKLDGDTFTNSEVIYQAFPNSEKPYHFGSRLAFDNNNHLYFSIGDRGNRDVNPQDITRDGGKIYRLVDNGNIPADNPFVRNSNAKKAIYSYGHRNPQGMTKHPETGAIWTHEHGPKGGDEINIIQKGKNYGWPKITYGVNYSGTTITDKTALPGMEQPVHYWVPSIAPSGMTFVSSDIYPNWKGNLLVGSLKFQYIDRCVIKDNSVVHEERILNDIGRVRSLEQGPDGYIYAGVENVGIIKLIPKK